MGATEVCRSCGFAYDDSVAAAGAVAAAVRAGAGEIADVVSEAGRVGVAARRPEPATWSAVEYGCHVRDVLLVQRERVLWARREDEPSPPAMGRDERVEHDGYAEQEPAAVARQLVDAAALFAGVLDRLDPDAWERTLVYRYPTTERRTLRWVAVHTLHEVRHHLGDARRSATLS